MKLPKQCVSEYILDKDNTNDTSIITNFYYCNSDYLNTIKESNSVESIKCIPESLFASLLEKVEVQPAKKQTKKKTNLKSTRRTRKRML